LLPKHQRREVEEMASIERLERLFFAISKEPVTFNELCRRAKIHPKTVRKYLKIIEYIQKQNQIFIERKEFRVVISEKKNTLFP
jgi:hypothetical protein